MREYDLIAKIIKDFPRSKKQRNKVFTCDAEILQFGDQTLAVTIDDFSPEEDCYTDEDPWKLGHNLAVATISDLFAAGAEPRFFLQSLAFRQEVSDDFIDKLVDGIRSALHSADCFLCGGDLSNTTSKWHYTGCALGAILEEKFLQRVLPDEPQTLWVTGTIGDANLAILSKTSTPLFELRKHEAQLIRKYATACCDTSGGLMDALYCLHQLRPELTIELDLERIPWAIGSDELVARSGFQKEILLTGGAGEYELLFSTPKSIFDKVRDTFAAIGISAIGETSLDFSAFGGDASDVVRVGCGDGGGGDSGINELAGVFVCKKLLKKKITKLPPCSRSVSSFDEYMCQLIDFTADLSRF